MFMPNQAKSERPIEGTKDAKILIVGDFPDKTSLKTGRPFAGAAETVLQSALHQAGLLSREVAVTNLIYDDVNIAKYWRETGAKGPSQLKGNIKSYVESIKEVVIGLAPEVVVAVGELTAFAFTRRSAITNIRGYPFSTEKLNLTVIPTLPPRQMIWSNYIWRYYLAHDLKKAREIANGDTIVHPAVEIIIPDSLKEVLSWLDYFARADRFSFDIEVSNYQVSCIGFSDSPTRGVSIPTDMRWTEEEELAIWRGISRVLENPKSVKIAQNGIFDVHFLAQQNGIFVENITGEKFIDTMISHHIMYPDFLKGLNFLGSVYTTHPYWKDELDTKTIKDES